jgi:SAM-dependent methyltransferase
MSLRSAGSLDRHAQDWEDLAQLDLYWSILSDSQKQFGRWELDEFFRSGDAEIGAVMALADRLARPKARRAALDFGCGAGRLTRALASHFDESVGVDLSSVMVGVAKEVNADDRSGELRTFERGRFDFVYTSNVLQHLVSGDAILRTISALLKVLAPGGLLVLQVVTFIPLRHRLQPRRRVYRGLRRIGVPPRFLYETFRLQPIRMTSVREADVGRHLGSLAAHLLEVDRVPAAGGTKSATLYVTR